MQHVLKLSLVAAAFLAGCSSSGLETKSSEGNGHDAPPRASGEKLTLEQIFGPEEKKKVDFSGKPKTSVSWIDARSWTTTKRDAQKKTTEHLLVDADTGTTRPFLDTTQVKSAIAKIPDYDKKKGDPERDENALERLSAPDVGRMTKARDALLIEVHKDLWVVRFDADTPVRVTNTPDLEEEEAAFSPDGKHIAFVQENDLYVGDTVKGGTTRLTRDGSELVLNGKLDWLYQEEVYGRGTYRSFWWSPDSRTLAFLRLDEIGVPIYTIVDDTTELSGDGAFDPKSERPALRVEKEFYPRAGEPNPRVKLGIARLEGGEPRFVDLSAYEKDEPLVVDVSWSPDGRLVYEVQDREQTWLDLRACSSDLSGDEKILRETTKAWVDRTDSPTWLADGTFLWFSERTGWKHLYHYRGSELIRAVTSGEWEMRELHGVDEKNGLVYFSGTERSPIGSDVYVVGIDGHGMKRLSEKPGTHTPKFNPDFTRYVDAWSDVSTPTQVRLHASDGREVRALDLNPVATLAKYALSKPELLQVSTRDGFAMEALLVKPVDFDATRKYPVMIFGYWGPHAPTVKDAWGGSTGMLQQLLAQRGVASWSCDNRSASGKGAVSAWSCYQEMGVGEMADVEDGVAWLRAQPWVDAERIGITGWSFGGFMSSYALTHSKSFALGVAGGSVTDWRNYDSIYTDRLMRTPQKNKDGYDKTSVVAKAADLHGELVLVHGAIDDNVHPGNTMQLAYALQRAGKPFQLMLYGRTRHGVGDAALKYHWEALRLAAIERVLLGTRPSP